MAITKTDWNDEHWNFMFQQAEAYAEAKAAKNAPVEPVKKKFSYSEESWSRLMSQAVAMEALKNNKKEGGDK